LHQILKGTTEPISEDNANNMIRGGKI
jgi:hypothetical protein